MPAAMSQRELDARVRALMKCMQSEPEKPENAISLLEGLKKEAAPTEEMLRATRAGVVINKLRSNANKEIARLATELVSRWRKTVEAEKAAKHRARAAAAAATRAAVAAKGDAAANPSSVSAAAAAAGDPEESAAAAAAAASASASAEHPEHPSPPVLSEEMRRPFRGDPEKRSTRSDGVDAARTKDDIRNNIITLFYNGLAYRSTESVAAVLARAIEVEEAALNAYAGTTREYKEKARSLMLNLKNRTNRALGERVMSGDIAPDRFVVMTAEELKSEELRAREDEMERENMKKAQVPIGEQTVAPGRQCNKCKEYMVSYVQAQTRSADEPMTTFFTCSVCGHRWKE